MHSFTKAKESGLEAVEFDIWLTADNELVVIHGGDSGEINFGACKDNC